MWYPYFRPTRKIHSSGYRCFEIGYLTIGDDNKAEKKVVLRKMVDHIDNYLGMFRTLGDSEATKINMDLLLDGNIRLFAYDRKIWWQAPGFSDAMITPQEDEYTCNDDFIDALYKKQKEEE